MKKLACIIVLALIAIGSPAQTKTTTSSGTKSSVTAKSTTSSTSKQGTTTKQTTAKQSSPSSTSSSKQSASSSQKSTSQKSSAKKDDGKKNDDKKDNKKDKKGLYDGKFRLAATGGIGLHGFQDGTGAHRVALQLKAGVNARMPVILPDLYLLGEGRLAMRTCGTHFTGQMSHIYLEVPVMAGYTLHLGDNFGIYAEAGPYIGLALIKTKMEFSHPNCGYKPIDIGIGLNVGAEMMQNIRLSLGFDYGFISPCGSDHAHNGGIWLTGTYMF